MNALRNYSYPVRLASYQGAARFPQYFRHTIKGDRESTIQFENYFRANSISLEPWFEVVFWKMFSQARVANEQTDRIIQQLTSPVVINPRVLLNYAGRFTRSESMPDFDLFRKQFKYRSNVIATVATFPAFLDPVNFPMVDTRVAKWVNNQYKVQNSHDSKGPQLIPSVFDNNSASTVLTMADFDFYIHWIRWTRHMARKLNALTGFPWRARDVEMAVFTGWGDRGCSHPAMKLNAI
jgi:hypothetical protein